MSKNKSCVKNLKLWASRDHHLTIISSNDVRSRKKELHAIMHKTIKVWREKKIMCVLPGDHKKGKKFYRSSFCCHYSHSWLQINSYLFPFTKPITIYDRDHKLQHFVVKFFLLPAFYFSVIFVSPQQRCSSLWYLIFMASAPQKKQKKKQ